MYTLFMVALVGGMLGVLFSLSSNEILTSVEAKMEERVFDAFGDVEWEDGRLQVDSDVGDVEEGIYLSVYDIHGNLLGGRIPYDFQEEVALSPGLQKVSDRGVKWYILDASSSVEGYGTVFVRGIASVTEAESSLQVTLHLSLVLFPIMVLLMAAIGYFFIGRTLKPVAKITDTAREIYENGDLSKRIGQVKGKDEIHQLARMFDRMLERLEASFEKEKRFTSDASHELRTPITVILSQCEYLLEDADLPGDERKAVEAIQRKAQNMTQMLSQLLFLSRADQDRQVLHREFLDLSMLTELAVEEQQEIACEKGIQIKVKIQEEVKGSVDETLFIRLWMNLIGNAITYGRKNGWIEVGLSRDGETIRGFVRDNGIGIAQEELPRIWERFYQVDASRNQADNPGAGLGLPMVQWIVRAHGGEISVQSQTGQGTEFAFELPC